MFVFISLQRAGKTDAKNIIREPGPSSGSKALKSKYFSQLQMTSVAEVAENHITVIGFVPA